MSIYIVIHPADESSARRFESLTAASEWAIKSNKASEEHWAYMLYEITSEKVKFIGRLSRAFGRDFDPRNCWSPTGMIR
jgi:hypothetical protein